MIRLILVCSLVVFAVSVNPVCEVCHLIANGIQKGVPEGPFDVLLDTIGIEYCQQKHIQSKLVCRGAVTQMMHSIINSEWRHLTDPHAICHNLRLCPKQYIKRNLTQEIQNIMINKPNIDRQNPTRRKSLKVLHISDLHPDLFYTIGAETNCSQPVCCRSNVSLNIGYQQAFSRALNGQVFVQKKTINLIGNQPEQKGQAGYWGSIAPCDLPFHTFDLFISSIKKLNLDFIIWTGDNTPHDIWQQSQSYNLNFTRILAQRLKQALNIPILPAMGNHESYPVNVYDFQGERQTALNGGLAEAWRSWIGEQAYKMLATKGYYETILPKFNNLKIISLNTQAGNDQNWFLIRNPTDPGQMLKWLQAQLKQSQQDNQFVYIIGHIPPNNNLNDWAVRYNAIIDRYSYTVRGQFFGHTHNDHLAFHHGSLQKDKIVNYYLVAPSLTTYDYRVPRYRVVDVDFDTLQVTDFHQYFLDLRKYTKKEDNAQFQLLYSFKSAYGLSNMSIKDGLLQFEKKLKSDIETQKKYDFYYNGGLKPGQNGSWHYCQAFATPGQCAACKGDPVKKSLFQKAAGQWKDLKHNQTP